MELRTVVDIPLDFYKKKKKKKKNKKPSGRHHWTSTMHHWMHAMLGKVPWISTIGWGSFLSFGTQVFLDDSLIWEVSICSKVICMLDFYYSKCFYDQKSLPGKSNITENTKCKALTSISSGEWPYRKRFYIMKSLVNELYILSLSLD